MADLTLSDALTDSVSLPVEENVVERDFVAALEAETFEDKVGETVGKTDYIPLLDDDEKGELQTQPGLSLQIFKYAYLFQVNTKISLHVLFVIAEISGNIWE